MKIDKKERRRFLKHVALGTTTAVGVAKLRVVHAGERPRQKPQESLYFESDNFKRYYSKL